MDWLRSGSSGDNKLAKYNEILSKYRSDFLLEDFNWVIEGRGFKSLDEYLKASRAGRGLSLRALAREAVWHLYLTYVKEINSMGCATWGQARMTALKLIREGLYKSRYDYVLVDEAQDLTPVALSLLAEICNSFKGVYLTSDASQSLYSRGFSWVDINEKLNFKGRSATLKRNFRSTWEITKAATAFLRAGEAGDAESLSLQCVHTGPVPALRGHNSEDELWKLVVAFIKGMCKELRLKTGAAAVLAPRNDMGMAAAKALTQLGLPASFMKSHELKLDSPDVKVLTMHSAKGLEFPVVVLIGMRDGIVPRLPGDIHEEEIQEETNAYRRLFYVSMTRAMRGLLVLYPEDAPSAFVYELNKEYWHL